MTDFHHSTAPCRHVLPPHRLRSVSAAAGFRFGRLRHREVEFGSLRAAVSGACPEAMVTAGGWGIVGSAPMVTVRKNKFAKIGCTLTEVNALRSRMHKMCGVSSLPCLALLVLNRQGSFLFDWQGLF